MAFTMEAASGVAFVASVALLRANFLGTTITAVVIYWIAFLLLRTILDIPEPPSGTHRPFFPAGGCAAGWR